MPVSGTSSGNYRTAIGLAVVFLLAALTWSFVDAQRIGGATWDETVHYQGTAEQLQVAARWLNGEPGAHYSSVHHDLAFYGTVSIYPAYLAQQIVDPDAGQYGAVYRITLHGLAFLSYLGSTWIAYLILVRLAGSQRIALAGTLLLLAYPIWYGYGLFNYKDMTTAFGVILSIFASVAIAQSREDAAIRNVLILLVFATILTGGTKLAALALIIPPWLATIYLLFSRGKWWALLASGVAVPLGLYIITPVAWSAPLSFLFAAVELMSRHGWEGCFLTAGECLWTQRSHWSAIWYAKQWALAQTPWFIIIGAVIGTFVAFSRRTVAWIVAASVLAAPGNDLFAQFYALRWSTPSAVRHSSDIHSGNHWLAMGRQDDAAVHAGHCSGRGAPGSSLRLG